MSSRDYSVESERQRDVEEFYRTQHINQTYDFVSKFTLDVIIFQELSFIFIFAIHEQPLAGEKDEGRVWQTKSSGNEYMGLL